MNVKYWALLKKETCVLVPPNLSMNIIGYKWVYKVKRTANGSVELYNVGLVAKKYNQQEGVDYEHILVPWCILL